MQIAKSLQVKIVSIGPGKLRPTSEAIMAAQAAASKEGKTFTMPIASETKDCIQVILALMDSSNRQVNRITLSFADGKVVVNNQEVGPAPDTLSTALTTVFAEIDKVASMLNAAGKIFP